MISINIHANSEDASAAILLLNSNSREQGTLSCSFWSRLDLLDHAPTGRGIWSFGYSAPSCAGCKELLFLDFDPLPWRIAEHRMESAGVNHIREFDGPVKGSCLTRSCVRLLGAGRRLFRCASPPRHPPWLHEGRMQIQGFALRLGRKEGGDVEIGCLLEVREVRVCVANFIALVCSEFARRYLPVTDGQRALRRRGQADQASVPREPGNRDVPLLHPLSPVAP